MHHLQYMSSNHLQYPTCIHASKLQTILIFQLGQPCTNDNSLDKLYLLWMSGHQVPSSQEQRLPMPGAKIRKFRQCAPHPAWTQVGHQSERPGVAGCSLLDKTSSVAKSIFLIEKLDELSKKLVQYLKCGWWLRIWSNFETHLSEIVRTGGAFDQDFDFLHSSIKILSL